MQPVNLGIRKIFDATSAGVSGVTFFAAFAFVLTAREGSFALLPRLTGEVAIQQVLA